MQSLNEQFEFCCIKKGRFFLENDAPVGCGLSEAGENNYYDVARAYYEERRRKLKIIRENNNITREKQIQQIFEKQT